MQIDSKEEVIEIACQQVLLQDASVFSVQWLLLPESCAQLIDSQQLLQRYLQQVRSFTRSLVRPVAGPDGVHFRFLSSPLSLLTFAPPEPAVNAEKGELRLRIKGGLLVQANERGRGELSFLAERAEGGVRVTLQLSDYHPLLLGSGTPSRLRRAVYRLTQAHIHKLLTVSYLRRLYRDLTGQGIRFSVKKVRVREGIDT